MKQQKLIGIVFIGSLCIVVTLSNCLNNGKSYNGGGIANDNVYSSIQKEDSVKQKRVPLSPNDAPQIEKPASVENRNIVGKWQGVSDVIYNNEKIPKYEECKNAFKTQNPFFNETELNQATQKEIDRVSKIVAIETQRTQNYFIEFTADGKYKFNNKNTGEQSMGDWKITTEYSYSYLFLKDGKTKKIYDYRMEYNEQGECPMRMPVPSKGKQNTMMRKME